MTYDEQIEVIQAAKEGKTIQFKPKADNHAEWQDDNMLFQFDFNTNDYRVKPENKYRPFKNADEAFQEAKKHGFWLRAEHAYMFIKSIDIEGNVYVGGRTSSCSNIRDMLSRYVWADDGSKCGILEE